MHAHYLIKNGKSQEAFEKRELKLPKVGADDVLIENEVFGLNFADVMSRLGYYKACPTLPAIIGYDVVGKIIEVGSNVTRLKVGERVVALTRFGGYASHSLTNQSGTVAIPETMDAAKACALATQYSTAYYAAELAMTLHPGEHVLIQAAAGGVGTALIQLAKKKGCIIYGTAGSQEKLDYIKKQGVDFAINYRNEDFVQQIKSLRGEKGVDVIFDSIGGNYVKRAFEILAPGGRIAMYGAASIAGDSDKKSLIRQIKTLLGFGKYRPTQFFAESQSVIGINMLKIGDFKPDILQLCMEKCVELYLKDEINPEIGKVYHSEQLAEAHSYLQQRKSIGKLVIKV